MNSYDEIIAKTAASALAGHPSEPILNKDSDHASILIRHLIDSAREELRILSGSLDVGIYGAAEVVTALQRFVVRGGVAYFLLDWTPAGRPGKSFGDFIEHHPFLDASKKIHVDHKALFIDEVPPSVEMRYPYHFLVADDLSFRFEEDKRRQDAVAQFGNKDVAVKLKYRFDEIRKLCLVED